jgi:hypothetical protein
MELDYELTPEEVGTERRGTIGSRTLTLFLFSGDSSSLDQLQSQIRLREHDLLERYGPQEVHGVLAHLREVDPPEMERVFKTFMENKEVGKIKCLLIPIHSAKDLGADLFNLIHTTLQQMTEGELKTISI